MNPPEVLPMPATESNRKALEEYIKEHYKSSAFNTCKRQHWPVTTGALMRRARRTVDLSGLSRAGKHESHNTRSAAEIAKSIPSGKLKSSLDCVER